MAGIRYWVWLSALRGIRSTALRLLLEHFGDPMEVYFAAYGAYDRVEGLLPRERKALENKSMSETGRILEVCMEAGIRVLTRQDAEYPVRLAQIYDAPPVLYVRGRLPYLDERPTIAVVGTRKASVYGLRMATRLGAELSQGGGRVLSGLALGIDAAAAKGALYAGSACVGVLGSAIDVDYPPQNRALIADVAATGAVVSEFPPGYPTLPENFPRRNRIISGLSMGVCVVEAPAQSGALITANLALEQGRDLFAVPGNADNPGCAGSNRLLRDCAKAVTCAGDILCEYEGRFSDRVSAAESRGMELPDAVLPRETPPEETPQPKDFDNAGIDNAAPIHYIDFGGRGNDFSQRQQSILHSIQDGASQVDDIIAETGLSPAAVLSELTILTIRDVVKPLPGKRYTLKLE